MKRSWRRARGLDEIYLPIAALKQESKNCALETLEIYQSSMEIQIPRAEFGSARVLPLLRGKNLKADCLVLVSWDRK